MLRGVCAPRPTSFRAIEHLTRRPYPPVQTGPRALQADATDRKRVRFAQLAHGDVLRCPFPNARQTRQPFHAFMQAAARAEEVRVLSEGGCE
jgi:hypothetical protein